MADNLKRIQITIFSDLRIPPGLFKGDIEELRDLGFEDIGIRPEAVLLKTSDAFIIIAENGVIRADFYEQSERIDEILKKLIVLVIKLSKRGNDPPAFFSDIELVYEIKGKNKPKETISKLIDQKIINEISTSFKEDNISSGLRIVLGDLKKPHGASFRIEPLLRNEDYYFYSAWITFPLKEKTNLLREIKKLDKLAFQLLGILEKKGVK